IIKVEGVDIVMRVGRYIDDSRRSACLQNVEQKIGQQEGREMIQRQRHLDAVYALAAQGEQGAGVVDQHIQAIVLLTVFVRQASHFSLRRQIRVQELNALVAG